MYAYGIDGRLEMTLNMLLRALRKCEETLGYHKYWIDESVPTNTTCCICERNKRLADKIQARIEKDFIKNTKAFLNLTRYSFIKRKRP